MIINIKLSEGTEYEINSEINFTPSGSNTSEAIKSKNDELSFKIFLLSKLISEAQILVEQSKIELLKKHFKKGGIIYNRYV